MDRSAALVLALVLGLGCGGRVGSDDTQSGAETMSEAPGEPATPRFLSLPDGAELLADPRTGAPRLQIGAGEGRVVAVVERRGEHYLVETILAGGAATRTDDPALDAADIVAEPIQPILGLEFYRLRAWVPVAGSKAIEPDPVAAQAQREAEASAPAIVPMTNTTEHTIDEYASNDYPPRQSHAARSKASVREYDVPAQAQVFWPDGSEAGVVRITHAFTEPGVLRETAAGSLLCFTIVTGSAHTPAGELCFSPELVSEHERAGGMLLRGPR